MSIFLAIPSMFAIISTMDTQAIKKKTVETKAQQSINFLGKGNEMEEDIDLDEEIVIPN